MPLKEALPSKSRKMIIMAIIEWWSLFWSPLIQKYNTLWSSLYLVACLREFSRTKYFRERFSDLVHEGNSLLIIIVWQWKQQLVIILLYTQKLKMCYVKLFSALLIIVCFKLFCYNTFLCAVAIMIESLYKSLTCISCIGGYICCTFALITKHQSSCRTTLC